MPRQVDHGQRRREIAEAVCSLVSARGLEAVSLRDVAAEAGISMGRVQHYFRTKDEMLLFALEYVGERDVAGVREALAGLPDPPEPRVVVRTVLTGLLGGAPEQLEAQRVSVAFQARALVEPRLAEPLLRGYAGIQALLEDVVRRGVAGGEAAEGTDPETAAAAVLALVDGLRVQTLLGHGTRERALAVLDDHLDRLFPG